jgi:hypothetical protein
MRSTREEAMSENTPEETPSEPGGDTNVEAENVVVNNGGEGGDVSEPPEPFEPDEAPADSDGDGQPEEETKQ